ncbi:MAG: protein translocase subunit SecD [Candidatus Dependentiae bacterium]|nr:protein translocase subunit SecD [Candidatus Dependentiae bacterium]
MNQSFQKALTSGFSMWILFAIATTGYLYRYGKQDIRFGIDLVGGTYITLEVQEDDIVKNYLNDKVRGFESLLKSSHIELDGKPMITDDSLVFRFNSSNASAQAESLFRAEEKYLKYAVDGSNLKVSIADSVLSHLITEAVEANIEILRSRFASLSEIRISKQGTKQIVVELPDVSDPHQAKMMIGKSAVLEFKLVEDSAGSREALLSKYDHELPEGTMILPGQRRGGMHDEKTYYLLPTYSPVSGKYFKTAKTDFGGQFGTDLVVSFEFDEEGGKRFHELTSENIGKTLAIVLDDEVIQAATIQSAIGSKGQITGNHKAEEASSLAKLLKSGAFKAKVNFIEERQIGPTLGQQAIKQGLMSCIIGLILLLLFGVFYYRMSGVFSFLTLVYNLILLLMFMSLMRATLTLPGIAGMILTVGMAIDCSILIYERIKEALKEGLSISAAVEDGFSEALWVILDSNITTFIVATVLFYFGTGPIKGFAVTMMIGIITTLVTGLFFLKSLFKFYLRVFNVQKLSI